MTTDTASDRALAESYARCGAITRAHGKTYAIAARLLAAENRRHVHAVYAFCRVADDIVDDLGDRPTAERAAALTEFGDRFRADLAAGHSTHPILAAVVRTVREIEIEPTCFDRFLHSMAMDLTTTTYETWPDLLDYMDGSAAVIGEMMLPVLRPHDRAAFEPARQLGVAFQLTNFIRDVGEDLERGRIYLPQEDIARFGANAWSRQVTAAWRELMRFEIERTRAIYVEADAGLALLPARSARCVGLARTLYSRILDRIESADYDVFTHRVRVPRREKALTAVRVLLRPAPGSGPTG